MILRARYVVPVEGEVIEDGVVETEHGRIVEVRQATSADWTSKAVAWCPDDVERAKRGTTSKRIDCGNVAILPGWVNAHTHLELTYLAGSVAPSSDFLGWLYRLVERSIASPVDPDAIRKSVLRGIEQSLGSGVTTIGDITRHPELTRSVLAESSLRAVSFGEVIAIGAGRDRLESRLNQALPSEEPRELKFAARYMVADGALRIGVSPHSPYTVEPEGLRACALRAVAQDAPLCIHLAESQHEDQFTKHATGPLADHLQRLGIWDDHIPKGGSDPIALAIRCGLLTPRTIAAHVNYVTDEQLARFASTGAHVAYCPRTHDAFCHPPHRFRQMLDLGINVCIGTDSLASNPSLCILDELRFLHRAYPDFPVAQLLSMGTIRGARALGLGSLVGSLTSGKRADIIAIPLDPTGDANPITNILESAQPPQVVIRALSVTM